MARERLFGRPYAIVRTMGRGVGPTQLAIVEQLASGHLSVAALAARLGLADNQVRRAVHALAGRGLVALTKGHGGFRADGMPSGPSLFVWLPRHLARHHTSSYPDNASMVAAAAELYIPDGAAVADVTWGKGAFWAKTDTSRFRLHASDLDPRDGNVAAADFRALPYPDASMHTVVLDPPYVHNPGVHITDHRYNNAATTSGMYHRDIVELYRQGMAEARRVGSQLWVKCKDEVESSKQRWSHIELYEIAVELGLVARDLFIVTPTSRTPTGRWATQHHARKVHSYLWVFSA